MSPRLVPSRPVLALACTLLLCACAPDAVRPSSAFDEWAAKVAVACNYQTIGRYEVGSLLGMNASDRATIFLDATSRLYGGQISADQWTLAVVSDLEGRPGDPGVACVLGLLPRR